MPDPLMLTDARAARFVRPSDGAVELIGRSPAITRVQELIRRGALLDGGALITAEPGADVEAVARELHLRGRHSTAPLRDRRLRRRRSGERRPSAVRRTAAVGADGSRIGLGRQLRRRGARRHAVPAERHRAARVARRRSWRASRATAKCASTARRSPPRAGSSRARRPASTPKCTRTASACDLYRRLSAVRIDLPPLRDRPDDVPALAVRLLDDICAADGRPARTFTQAALALIGALTWPGNLAELRDAIERVVADTRDDVIQIEHLLPALQLHRARAPFVPIGNLRDARLRFERDYIAAVLQHHDWRMAAAAQTLGIQRPNLYRKARQLGIPLARLSD